MRLMIALILLLCSQYCYAHSRLETTKFYQSLLSPATINYQIFSGYQDVEDYVSPEFSSVYYSLWESSTKTFADHSAPLIIYLQGGPGRSSQYAAFREIGPLAVTEKVQGKYKLSENPWSWNYYAHLMFVDQPIGTGFSYNKAKDPTNTPIAAKHFLNFMTNFIKNDVLALRNNPIYLAGEGFAGHFLPAFASLINQNKTLPFKISGILLAGGLLDAEKQVNTLQSFLTAAGVGGEKERKEARGWINEAIVKIRNGDKAGAMKSLDNVWGTGDFYNGMSIYNYKRYSEDSSGSLYAQFLNDNKAAHGVSANTKFIEYNQHIESAFTMDTITTYTLNLEYLLDSDLKVLIYHGQNDYKFSAAGAATYLQSLNWKGAKDWRESEREIWREGGKVAGWVKKEGNLIFAVVKGAGHYVYEDETNEAKSIYLMINHFFNHW